MTPTGSNQGSGMSAATCEPNFKKPRTRAQRGMYGRGAKAKATKLHSQLVRARGRCEKCGSASNLQAAHIVGRRFAWTRSDESNAFCLCASCHAHFTNWPDEFLEFVYERRGRGEFERLKKKALTKAKFDWDAEVIRLSALLAEIQQ